MRAARQLAMNIEATIAAGSSINAQVTSHGARSRKTLATSTAAMTGRTPIRKALKANAALRRRPTGSSWKRTVGVWGADGAIRAYQPGSRELYRCVAVTPALAPSERLVWTRAPVRGIRCLEAFTPAAAAPFRRARRDLENVFKNRSWEWKSAKSFGIFAPVPRRGQCGRSKDEFEHTSLFGGEKEAV